MAKYIKNLNMPPGLQHDLGVDLSTSEAKFLVPDCCGDMVDYFKKPINLTHLDSWAKALESWTETRLNPKSKFEALRIF